MFRPIAFCRVNRDEGFHPARRKSGPARDIEGNKNCACGVGRIIDKDSRVAAPRKIMQRLALPTAETLVRLHRQTGHLRVALNLKTGARQRGEVCAGRAQADQQDGQRTIRKALRETLREGHYIHMRHVEAPEGRGH